jgi:hypothetical protein
MNDDHDPLEAELHALRPHGISAGLPQQIAARLECAADNADPSRDRQGAVPGSRKNRSLTVAARHWRWRVVLAGGLAAACLAVLVLWWRGEDGAPQHDPIVNPPSVPGRSLVQAEDHWPTLLVYRQALAQSPEAFDALLDRHAALAARWAPPAEPMYVFPLSRSHLLE